MFETELLSKIKNIFDFDKVTMDSPSEETREQEGAFVEIETPRVTMREKKCTGKVTGKIRVFAQGEKLPFDYFSKCIEKADPDDKKDLFFFDVGQSVGRFLNIDERTVGFVFFFSTQHDPNLGTINSVNIEVNE